MSVEFVTCRDGLFWLQNGPLRLRGANAYYLGLVAQPVVDSIFGLARKHHLNVLRLWAFAEVSELVERLDYVIYQAGVHGIHLILTLGNYWDDFGGINGYARKLGLADKHQFYSDSACSTAFLEKAAQLMTRGSSRTGRLNNEEPAILAWELLNEPRHIGGRANRADLLRWIQQTSKEIHRLAPQQLLCCGDEGFLRKAFRRPRFLFDGSHGVNFKDVLQFDSIDFGTFHLYANWFGEQRAPMGGQKWIEDHAAIGRKLGKPVILEEFGATGGPSARAAIYQRWLQAAEDQDLAGTLVWMIGLPKDLEQSFALDDYVLLDGALELEVIRQYAVGNRMKPNLIEKT